MNYFFLIKGGFYSWKWFLVVLKMTLLGNTTILIQINCIIKYRYYSYLERYSEAISVLISEAR